MQCIVVYDELCSTFFLLCSRPHTCLLPQDSGFLDGAFESQNAALVSLSRILYDELVKSLLLIIEKLDLSLQKVTPGEEVRGCTSWTRKLRPMCQNSPS